MAVFYIREIYGPVQEKGEEDTIKNSTSFTGRQILSERLKQKVAMSRTRTMNRQ
jgi:hypothetical protein